MKKIFINIIDDPLLFMIAFTIILLICAMCSTLFVEKRCECEYVCLNGHYEEVRSGRGGRHKRIIFICDHEVSSDYAKSHNLKPVKSKYRDQYQ